MTEASKSNWVKVLAVTIPILMALNAWQLTSNTDNVVLKNNVNNVVLEVVEIKNQLEKYNIAVMSTDLKYLIKQGDKLEKQLAKLNDKLSAVLEGS